MNVTTSHVTDTTASCVQDLTKVLVLVESVCALQAGRVAHAIAKPVMTRASLLVVVRYVPATETVSVASVNVM